MMIRYLDRQGFRHDDILLNLGLTGFGFQDLQGFRFKKVAT